MNKILYPLYLKLRFIMYIGILGSTLVLTAQQNQVYNQFFMNPFIYNPAYAGVDGHPVLFVLYKQQWAKINDGPQLMYASYHTPLKGGIGIGATVLNDSQGPLSTTSFKGSASYLVNIDRKHFLRFGMSLGLGSNQLKLPEDALGDPSFQGEGSMFMTGDFGVSYHFGNFNAGFALPNLFSSQIITEKSLSPIDINPTDNMLFKMNYRGHINHEIAIEPHIIYRISSVVPSQYEFATIVHLKHIIWVGGTYRQYAGFVGLIGAKFNNKFAIGGAFELGSQNYGNLTGSSFEISLGVHLGNRKDHERSHIDHSSSFLRTHNQDLIDAKAAKDAREVAQDSNELGIVTPADTKKLVDNNQIQDTPKEWSIIPQPISKTNAAGEIETGQRLERTTIGGEKEVIIGFTPPRGAGVAWTLAPGTSQLLERTKPDETKEAGVKWVRINENGTLEQIIKWESVLDETAAEALLAETARVPIDEPIDTQVQTGQQENTVDTEPTADNRTYEQLATSDVHLEVKRGGHFLELPVGNHVIGGVYDNFQAAEDVSDRLFSRGMRDTKVGYVSAREKYYVVVGSFSSVSQAQQSKGKIKSSYNLKDVWVLKVTN